MRSPKSLPTPVSVETAAMPDARTYSISTGRSSMSETPSEATLSVSAESHAPPPPATAEVAPGRGSVKRSGAGCGSQRFSPPRGVIRTRPARGKAWQTRRVGVRARDPRRKAHTPRTVKVRPPEPPLAVGGTERSAHVCEEALGAAAVRSDDLRRQAVLRELKRLGAATGAGARRGCGEHAREIAPQADDVVDDDSELRAEEDDADDDDGTGTVRASRCGPRDPQHEGAPDVPQRHRARDASGGLGSEGGHLQQEQ